MSALLTTALSLPNRRQGKVRDLYDVTLPNGDEGLLSVATDRVSVFDVVLRMGSLAKGLCSRRYQASGSTISVNNSNIIL